MILKSRYKDVVTEFDPESGIITSNSYIRFGFENDGTIMFIDFDGGPFVQIGHELGGRKIKSIKELSDNKFKIEYV